MSINIPQKVGSLIHIVENMEDVNMQEFEEAERNAKDDGSSELPPEILIPKYQLQDLASETAKLKSLGAMESIPNDKLVKLLNILELNIRDGSKVVPLPTGGEEDDEDEDKMWLELAMERVTRAAISEGGKRAKDGSRPLSCSRGAAPVPRCAMEHCSAPEQHPRAALLGPPEQRNFS